MSIDRAGLVALSRYDDARLGISEEFLRPRLGGAFTVAVFSRPLEADPADVGWVFCHSFGMEQIHLYRMEVRVARALSTAGFPVLRFHSQGYGDSELLAGDISLASHVESAADAVDLATETMGVERVGVFGARFGGLVAAITAGAGRPSHLVLVEPVAQGRRFMRDFLWQRVFSEMAASPTERNGGDPAREVLDQLTAQGCVDVNGFLLRKECHDEISKATAVAGLGDFAGPALLLSVSRSSQPSASVEAIADRLRSNGGSCTLQVIVDEHAAEFGRSHFRADEEVLGKADTQLTINRTVAERVVGWAHGEAAGVGS